MDDRRATNRLPVPRVLVKIATPERMRVAYLKDLSEGGVFIRTDKPLALERVIDVDLLPPGRMDPIRLKGRITRVQNDEASKQANLQGMGVKFIELTAQAETELRDLVQEYSQARPAVAVQSTLPDDITVALKQALESCDVLRATLAQREQELHLEHERRGELSNKVLALTSELEAIKAKGSDGHSVAVDVLQVELKTAQAEIAELKMRSLQIEATAEGFRQEISVLESDDANTRRLAETLAQQKQKLEVELRRAREELVNQTRILDAERSSGATRATEVSRQLEAEKARRQELEIKVDELSTHNVAIEARLKEMEPMLETAKKHVSSLGQTVSELTSTKTRLDTLEQALADEKAKTARLTIKERELRQLLAAITAKGDDVVVMEDDVPQNIEEEVFSTDPVSPPISSFAPAHPNGIHTAPTPISTHLNAIGAAIGDVLSQPTPSPISRNVVLTPFTDAYTPGQTIVTMEMPETEPEPAPEMAVPPPPPLDATTSRSGIESSPSRTGFELASPSRSGFDPLPVDVTLDVDVDGDWGGQAIAQGPAATQTAFLDRLRSNDRLIRRATFFEYAASDSREQQIIGSLMGGDRYEDLKILSRGQCTPEQLESHLIRFHELGLIEFES